MASSDSALHGSCACERNQYTILVPAASTPQAQVFFDNSAANRRSQATPLTAWLRIPLAWYHSSTFAAFPDETHQSIRRTFHTPSTRESRGDGGAALQPTRRQFCGYCGTHLTAWDEGQTIGGGNGGVGNEGVGGVEGVGAREGGVGGEWMDVTLGSLLDESLRELEALGVLGESEDEADKQDFEDVDDAQEVVMSNTTDRAPQRLHQMQNRGMPYFESMVENSRLGRIKRQKGGHTSRDGRRTVEWEVIEMGGEYEDGGAGVAGEDGGVESNKRPKLEP